MKSCFLLNPTASVIYCHPMNNAGYLTMAQRFVANYQAMPPGCRHKTVIVCNGAPPSAETRALFAPLDGVEFLTHDNSGFDLGAFQAAARQETADVAVFLGASSFATRPGWLARVIESTQQHGIGLYGTMHNNGDDRFTVYPHIRTTGFWCSPKLFNAYPHRVSAANQRYEFEHGASCLTSWVRSIRLRTWVVTWTREYDAHEWKSVPDGFHAGDQGGLIFKDRLAEPPYHA